VNFSFPEATAECGLDTIAQVDATGLTTGDLFPVGTTILQWVAFDIFGNASDTCEIKVIVNDFHTPPSIVCPDSITVVNDFGMCGAVVTEDLSPTIEDNCPDNLAVVYDVTDEFGNSIFQGVEDATGETFPGGVSTVTYTVYDQPLLLITEVIQDGMSTGIEIGNIGPAAVDISCADVSRIDEFGAEIVYNIPNGTIVPVGGVFTHFFTGAFASGDRATFRFSFTDIVLDEISINEGTLFGDNIIRIDAVDNDDDSDWMVVNDCTSGSFDAYNPELPVYTDNGSQTSLQSRAPSEATCSFTVTVLDIEAPTCASQDTLMFEQGSLTLIEGMCMTEVVTVGAGTVADVNVRDLIATLSDVGEVTVLLSSPSGTEVTLFSNLCDDTEDVMVSLDDSAPSSILAATCSPLGNGSTFQPQESFKTFFGEEAAGDWTLSVYTTEGVTGSIDSWILDVITNSPYSQMDTLISNDMGLCSAEFEWVHPVFSDNCCEGSISVTYEFSNEVTGETSTETEDILTSSGFINESGQIVSQVFEVGETVITYTLTDLAGNISNCGFTVTVIDDESPVFPDDCADVSIFLEPGDCEGALPIIPEVTDNCGVDSIAFFVDGVAIDETMLPIGMNEITLIATDINGNMDTCTFTANVVEFDGSDTNLACNDAINLSLGVDCTAELTPDMILEGGPYGCYDDFCITVTTTTGIVVDNIFDIGDVIRRS